MKRFTKRTGTTNKGIEYENLNIANIVLNLLENEKIKNFYISSNDKDFGAFDDVVVEIELEGKKEIYALQLKHNDRGQLALERLKSTKGDFSLSKYFDSFQNTQNVGQKHILFTNLKFNVEDKTRFQLQDENFLIEITKYNPSDILKFSDETNYCYKFHIVDDPMIENSQKIREYKQFFENFFLYSNQKNVNELKTDTLDKFKTKFRSNETEFDKYLKIITAWSQKEGSKEMLDKRWMQRGIALQILSSRIKPLTVNPVNEKMKILRDAISAFDITVFEEDSYDKVRALWGDAKNELKDIKKMNTIREKYQIDSKYIKDLNSVDDMLLSKLLWLTGTCPLIVTEDVSVQKAMELCCDKKFVLLGRTSSNHQRRTVSVFQTLSDLQEKTNVYDKLIKDFTFSIQEKKELPLKFLENKNSDILKNLKPDLLLEMLNGPIIIGDKKEILPDPYVERSLSINVIDIRYLKEMQESALIIIYCVTAIEEMKRRFGQHNFIDMDDFLNNDNKNNELISDSKREINDAKLKHSNIYVSRNEYKSDYVHKLSEKLQWSKNCHQFKLGKDGNLEWIQSKENVGELERFLLPKNYFVEEKILWKKVPYNNINLIINDPGMGKSEFLKNFKNNCFADSWAVIMSPQDAESFCKKFEKCQNRKLAFETFLFDNKYKDISTFDKNFLRMMVKEKSVILMWDALDEISKDHLKSVIATITQLSKEMLAQIVTSRIHLKKRLEKEFIVMAQKLNQFGEKEQISYAKQRLYDIHSTTETEVIIEKIKTSFAAVEVENVLGIPLQLFMLTELFRQKRKDYLELNKTFALNDLYKYFIEEKFVHYFRNKCSLDIENTSVKNIVQLHQSETSKYYETLALEALLPTENLKQMGIDGKRVSHEKTANALSVGLVKDVEDSVPRFLHNSFAEYFVALYFSKNFQHRNVLENIIFSPRYLNVRFFFDLMLADESPPHVAILYGKYEMLDEYGDEIYSCKDRGGRSLLHVACFWGSGCPRLKIKKTKCGYFVKDNIDLNYYSHRTIGEDLNILKHLNILEKLSKKCDFSEDDIFSTTPLELALKSKNFIAAALLINRQQKNIFEICNKTIAINILYYSAHIGCINPLECFEPTSLPLITNTNEMSLLHIAAPYANYTSQLLKIETYKNNINIRDNRGKTAIYVASENGNEATVELLTVSGADVNLAAEYLMNTPLCVASENGHEEIVELLVSNGAGINIANEDGDTPLYVASKYSYEKIVEFLVSNGAGVNLANKYGDTPLYVASKYGYAKIVEFLVSNGAGVNFANEEGDTPLYVASISGHEKIVEFLVSNEAAVNLTNEYGDTPLYVALKYGHEKIVEFLVSNGAGVNLTNEYGDTPLYIASENGHETIVEFLVSNGAGINIANEDGDTPLYVASKHGYEKIVEILVSNDAGINIANEDGITPLLIASHNGHEKIVEFLVSKGVDVNLASKKGFTSFYVALRNGHEKIVEFLVSNGADVNLGIRDGVTSLHFAPENGHEKIVEFLVSNGADVNLANKYGFTPLLIASQSGHEKIVEFLVGKGADVNLANKDGFTSLYVALLNGHKKIVEFLVSNGADVNLADEDGGTPLYVASENGHEKIVELLVSNGADANLANKYGFTPLLIASQSGHEKIVEFLVFKSAHVSLANKDGFTSLHVASQKGHKKIVEFLVSNGAGVNFANEEGDTPLYVASKYGYGKIVEFLVNNGADVNLANKYGFTPLYVASKYGYEKIVEFLVNNGADVNLANKDGITPLLIASHYDQEQIVEFLVSKGADVNLADEDGDTPLYVASENGHEKIVEFLVFKSADVSLANKGGFTSLYVASQKSHEKIVEFLVNNGADVNLANKYGFTPLYVASKYGYEKIVEFLVSNGAGVNFANEEGDTPLYVASKYGYEKIVEFLVNNGADVNLADKDGHTPLLIASLHGHEKIVEFLGSSGADVNLVDEDGHTPLLIASLNGHEKIVEFLVNNGASVNLANKDGFTSLHAASQKGHEKIVDFLVSNGADVNLANKDSFTSFYEASKKGHEKIVEFLVNNGADVNLANKDGFTSVYFASLNGHEKIVEFLVNSGADVYLAHENGFTSLYVASQNGHKKIVEFLVSNGASVNLAAKYVPSMYFTALLSRRRHKNILESHLGKVSEVNLPDEDCYTPLFVASQNGHEKIVEFLVSNGAGVNIANKNGFTPLYVASENGHEKIVEFLVSNGADVNLAEDDVLTPLYAAPNTSHQKNS